MYKKFKIIVITQNKFLELPTASIEKTFQHLCMCNF